MNVALERLRALRASGRPSQAGWSVSPAEIRESVEAVSPADLPGDWRLEWEERAAIREYDGGQAREHAEAEALREIVERMRMAGETERSIDF